MGIRFEFLRAGGGDCILISINDNELNILIDGGLAKTYNRELKKRLEIIKKKNKHLDLAILTHYDNDHIGGILKLLDDEKKLETRFIKEFWFNSFDKALVNPSFDSNQTSARQQIKLDEYIKELLPSMRYISKVSIDNQKEMFLGENREIKFYLLSPNNQKLDELSLKYEKEKANYQTSAKSNDYDISIEELSLRDFKKDTSLTNGASIAFILEYESKKFLFLGDSHIDLIVDSIKKLGYSSKNRLKLEFVKLSHHGSSKNLNSDFLDLIESQKFVISTNGGRHKHPNKETIAKIITHPQRTNDDIEFICNYEHIIDVLTPTEKRRYKAIFFNDEVSY